MTTRFAPDKANARFLGICAGLARSFDVDPTLVRITLVLLGLFTGPVVILAYILAALIAQN